MYGSVGGSVPDPINQVSRCVWALLISGSWDWGRISFQTDAVDDEVQFRVTVGMWSLCYRYVFDG